MTSRTPEPASDGPARYRLNATTGQRICAIPSRCRAGHDLTAVGYLATERHGRLHICCQACAAQGHGDDAWRFDTAPPAADAAELNDALYADLLSTRD